MMNEANEYIPGKSPLNLAIVGGGKACRVFLQLLQKEPFPTLNIRIVGVCDVNPKAEGLRLASEMGIYTTDNFLDLFTIKDLDAVIELTGSRELLLELISQKPQGLGVLEHNIGRFLRYLYLGNQELQSAQQQVASEKGASDFLMQQSNERIAVLNPDFLIVEANEAYLKAAEKSRDEVIGAHCYEISHGLSAPCSSVQPELGCPLVETLRTGESAHVIHEHFLSGEHAIYCNLVTYPLKDKHGKVAQVIEVGSDLTAELSSRWENRIKAVKDNLKKLIQEDRMISLGKLVASSVHEINNPIQGLLTFSHLMLNTLEEGEPSPKDLENFKEHLRLMSRELERCGDIVTGLLSFSRQTERAFSNVDLNEILEQVIALTHHKMEVQDVELSTKISPRPLVLNGDINQLQQCFLNLIFNSIEAMPEGGKLSILSKPDKDGKNAMVEIRDTGCGIPEESMGHIFDPFFTTKGEGEGTGLGLSIVYGIVRNHGGEIKVESQVGKGSAFVLNFPVE
jgi:signal transduction histidine kinase